MRHDTAFHVAVGVAARNRFLVEAIERERLELNRVFPLLPGSAAWHSRSAAEHANVLAAIEEGDADAASAAMTLHSRTPPTACSRCSVRWDPDPLPVRRRARILVLT